MEQGRIMIMHSVIIGILLYLFMILALKQKQSLAESQSILISALILVYMILFGHGLPTSINSHLFQYKYK